MALPPLVMAFCFAVSLWRIQTDNSWPILVYSHPLSTLMYTLVFAGIAKNPYRGIPPQLFYLSGICCLELFCSLSEWTSSHVCK